MRKSLIRLLLPNFPPSCACVSQVTSYPHSFFPGVLTSSDFEFIFFFFSLAQSFSLAPLNSVSEELLGLFEGVPSQCELFLTEMSVPLSLSLRTRHPSRSVSLSQTCRYNPLLLRVCQLFTDNCQFVFLREPQISKR